MMGEKKVIYLCKKKIDQFKKKNKERFDQNPLLSNLLDFGINRIN